MHTALGGPVVPLEGPLMNVPSLAFYPTLGPLSRDGRRDSCAHRCGLSALWRALELASTLRTLTVHLVHEMAGVFRYQNTSQTLAHVGAM